MENGTSQLGKILDESRQKEKLRDIGGCQRAVQTLLQLDHLPRYTTKLTKKKSVDLYRQTIHKQLQWFELQNHTHFEN